MEKRNERILSIELLRFLFCLIIIGYHFCSHYLIQYVNKSETPLFFSRGYIADEFFFVTSGFFFANSVLHESNKDSSLSYLLKRIKRIAFPYYTCWIVSFIIIQVSKFIIDHGSFPMWSGYVNHYNFSGSIWKDLFNSLYELLFVDMLGFKHGFYSNPVAWFISATLITFFMIMPFLKKGGRKYTIYVAPLFSFFIYAVLSQRFDFINAPHSNMFSITHINSEIEALAEAYGTSSGLIPIYKGLFRSFAGINLGIFIFGITETQEITIKNIVLVRIAVSILWSFVLLYSIYPFPQLNIGEEVIAQGDYLITIIIGIAFLGTVLIAKSNKVNSNIPAGTIKILGQYSSYVYFSQAIIYSAEAFLFSMNLNKHMMLLLFFVSILMISLVIMIIEKLFLNHKGRKGLIT